MLDETKKTQEEIRIQAEKKAQCESCREKIKNKVSKTMKCPVFEGRICPLYEKRTFENFNWNLVKIIDHKGKPLDIDKIKKFPVSPHLNLLMLGDTGIGKTHLAEAIYNQYKKKRETDPDIQALWSGDRRDKMCKIAKAIGAYDLYLYALKYATPVDGNIDADGRAGMWNLMKSEFLDIDDLGSEKQTEKEVFNTGLKDLLEKHRGKRVVTSNLCLKDLRERYGEKIFSRLMERCIIAIIEGEDYRKRGLK